MIFLILKFLQVYLHWKIPIAFTYVSTRMLLAALTALILTIFFGPLFIRKLYEWKIGQHIRKEDCPLLGKLHEKKQDTPTMGGVLILFSLMLSLLIWMDLRHFFTWILFTTIMWIGLVGGIDDFLKLKYKNTKGLSPRKKFIFQLIFGGFLAFFLLSPIAERELRVFFQVPIVKETREKKELTLNEYQGYYYVPFYKKPVVKVKGPYLFFSFIFMLFVITGSSNAVNLSDGLDGLASGLVFFTAFVLAGVAFLSSNVEIANYLNILYIEGSGEIAVFLSAVCGACLGFLWYNGHPAQVFMGDIGSLSLGAVLGVSAILLRKEILLALVGGVFVAEAVSVILQVGSYRLRNKKRIFLCAPLHHHYEYKGWPESKVVLRFWIIGIILAMIGLMSLKFQ